MTPADTITDVRAVVNLREPDKPWRCAWQTPAMPAPAFDYFETKAQADASAASHRLQPCRECGRPSATGLHSSCAGFREWIKRGGTLD